MAVPPLDIEMAAGAAAGDLDPPEPSEKADADRSAARIQSLRVGTNLRQAFVSQKNRSFDLGGGLIISESISGSHERQGFYLQASYYPRIGIESYTNLRDPSNYVFVPTIVDAFPRLRLGVHGTIDSLSFDAWGDRGITISASAELVRGNRRAHTPGCIVRFGYSGEDSIGLKLSGGVREVDGRRYWVATLGLTVRVPAIGGLITVPIFCGQDDE